jgi:DNA helicase-2/ATP-dependent DNA helicase PcrA
MDKKVMFAVAGSGKTTHILNELNLTDKALLLTYTNSNFKNLQDGILRKWGHYPENIKVQTYFNFLYQFCYRPFLSYTIKAKGINWKPNPNLFAKNEARYIDDYKRLYSNRIAKLLEERKVLERIKQRLVKYFDVLYIDEIQDFAGNDFNFLKQLTNAEIKMLFVGDFYQHTFDTSRDGSVNKNLHEDYAKYQLEFKNMGLEPDHTTLVKSHRCSPSICEFIATNIGIQIESHRIDNMLIKIITDNTEALSVHQDNSIVKLFYQEHYKYNCYSKNWGDCKGEDKYGDVCVVLNSKTWDHLQQSKLKELPAQTRNKLYVACSRAKGNLILISDQYFKTLKQGA